MAKGFYTQGLAVLFESSIDSDELRSRLTGHKIVKAAEPAEDWAVSDERSCRQRSGKQQKQNYDSH